MKMILMIVMLLIAGVGCSTKSYESYYENGQVKEKWDKEGFIDWSDGAGKQMPFSNISVNGVNAGVPNLKK